MMMSKGKVDANGTMSGECPECGEMVWADRPRTCACPRCGRIFQMVKAHLATCDLAAVKSELRYMTARA